MTYFINDFWHNSMTYTTWNYFLLVGLCLVLYYVLPLKVRWSVLLLGSVLFYNLAADSGGEWTFLLFSRKGFLYYIAFSKPILFFYLTIIVSYAGGRILQKRKNNVLFFLFLTTSVLLLLAVKIFGLLPESFNRTASLIVPVGLSFYSLQIYAYLYDVYHGKADCEKNLFKYILFISFFPQILQGPIPRYAQMRDELFIGHRFNYDGFAKGLMLVIWGFFLKFMIAERASVIVNALFADYRMYQGAFSLVAGALYGIQLYTDFLACVCMSRGVAGMFGITLAENFLQPYLATSVRDFWRRWHISLSSWLRDYVYIPLGGSRKGTARKYLNLIITFLISGIWHGNGLRFLVWGLLHAVYQILGGLLRPVKEFVKHLFGVKNGTLVQKTFARIITFFLVLLGWIIFRADTLEAAFEMLRSIFTVYNPWVLFDDSLLKLGLDWKEWMLLIGAIYVLVRVEILQERVVVRDAIMRQPVVVRWALMLTSISIILVFGKYGYGFNAADFIYRGF